MTHKPDGLLKAGLIVNIVLSVTSIIGSASTLATIEKLKEIDLQLWQAISSLNGLVILFGIIVPIFAILLSVFAMYNSKYKVAAGVLGIISNLIGGILVLCGKYEDDNQTTIQ